jgi:hypothetical protein
MASLRELVESAFVELLASIDEDCTIYGGVSVETKAAPAVVVRLASATEEPVHSGNYVCSIEVHIKSIATDAAAHNALCSAVRGAIWNDELATGLQTAEPGLRVFGASAPHSIDYDTDDDCWVESQTVELYCAGHTFPA